MTEQNRSITWLRGDVDHLELAVDQSDPLRRLLVWQTTDQVEGVHTFGRAVVPSVDIAPGCGGEPLDAFEGGMAELDRFADAEAEDDHILRRLPTVLHLGLDDVVGVQQLEAGRLDLAHELGHADARAVLLEHVVPSVHATVTDAPDFTELRGTALARHDGVHAIATELERRAVNPVGIHHAQTLRNQGGVGEEELHQQDGGSRSGCRLFVTFWHYRASIFPSTLCGGFCLYYSIY